VVRRSKLPLGFFEYVDMRSWPYVFDAIDIGSPLPPATDRARACL
jgi:hypothetical protein